MALVSPELAGGFFTSATWEAPILGHASHFICLTPGTTLSYPHQPVTLPLSSGVNLPFYPHPDSFVLVPLQLKQRGNLTLPLFALSEVYHLFWGYAFSAIYKNRVCFKVLQNFDITGVGAGVNETVAYKGTQGTFLVVQWLRLGAFNAGGTGRIPGPGTKILHDTVRPKKIFFK